MKVYAALAKTGDQPVLVRDGFAWGALILGPFWLGVHRAWIAAAISLAAFIPIAVFVPEPAGGVLWIGLALILGFTGNDLRCWALEQRGYRLVHVLAARDWDEAWIRLLTHRPDLTVRLRPEPA